MAGAATDPAPPAPARLPQPSPPAQRNPSCYSFSTPATRSLLPSVLPPKLYNTHLRAAAGPRPAPPPSLLLALRSPRCISSVHLTLAAPGAQM